MRRAWWLLALRLAAVSMVTVTGCAVGNMGGLTGSPAMDGFGATQGGVQDMGLARELIAQGRVPPSEAFVVEGMFSEHDLPLSGGECETLLCLRTAVGWAPTLAGDPAAWLQVGMSSTIDPATYQREPISLVITVDVSGSMFWNLGGGDQPSTAMGLTQSLLRSMILDFTEADRIALVTYGSEVETVLDYTPGDQHSRLTNTVNALADRGSTNMEAGLQRAFQLAAQAQGRRRVMLFTDVQPNVGATTPSEFETMAANAAQNGISLTVIGVGSGLGAAVMNSMSHLRGGNAFTVMDPDDVTTTMEEDWPWMLEPIAYNLQVQLAPGAGFTVAQGYGFPAGEDDQQELDLTAESVFLSRKRGALLVQLTPEEQRELADLSPTGSLSYVTPAGETVTQALDIDMSGAQLDGEGRYFMQPGVEQCVALALLVSAMESAAERYAEDADAATAIMQAAVERYGADIEGMDDSTMQTELALAQDLLALMQQGAEQGDLYGAF